jgi:hypothetical protein
MDSFDVERLQAYRHKIFRGAKLTDDQIIDFDDLKMRQADVIARKVIKEERNEIRKQAEDDRKTQRELFQQQRELLLLSRRMFYLISPSLVSLHLHKLMCIHSSASQQVLFHPARSKSKFTTTSIFHAWCPLPLSPLPPPLCLT